MNQVSILKGDLIVLKIFASFSALSLILCVHLYRDNVDLKEQMKVLIKSNPTCSDHGMEYDSERHLNKKGNFLVIKCK